MGEDTFFDLIRKIYNDKLKVRSLFEEIPSQLSKHEKKFKITSLSKDAKKRDYEDAFMWLSDYKIVSMAFNSTEPTIGLKLSSIIVHIKCICQIRDF